MERAIRGAGPRVVVTGSEYPAGLAALRGLARAGFEPWAAVTSKTALGARSRAAAGHVEVPGPRNAPGEFAAAVAAAATGLGAAAVLPGTEAALLALARHRDEFPAGVAVGAPSEEVVRRALDKGALEELSSSAGLAVPATQLVTLDDMADPPALPAVVKPIRSELEEGGRLRRFEARRVDSTADLARALRALPGGAGIAQPYLEGRLLSLNGVAFEGEVHGVNQHVVRRVWPERCGAAVYSETIPMTAGRERAAAAFMRELGWSGVFNLQIIEAGGRDHVIDLNPRFYASLPLAEAAGVNLPAIWASLLLGRRPPAAGYRAGVRFRDETNDVRAIIAAVRAGRPAAAAQLLPRRGTVHARFSLRDPRPATSIAVELAAAVRRRVTSRR